KTGSSTDQCQPPEESPGCRSLDGGDTGAGFWHVPVGRRRAAAASGPVRGIERNRQGVHYPYPPAAANVASGGRERCFLAPRFVSTPDPDARQEPPARVGTDAGGAEKERFRNGKRPGRREPPDTRTIDGRTPEGKGKHGRPTERTLAGVV